MKVIQIHCQIFPVHFELTTFFIDFFLLHKDSVLCQLQRKVCSGISYPKIHMPS